MAKTRIPIYTPYIGKDEARLVADCMESTWISSQGKYIEIFEEKIQEYTGASNAIAVFNGTVALHLAMTALDIGPGDEVITTNFTYVASTNAILYTGAKPIFADIDPKTWNLDPSKIEEKISNKTKAILYTNIYGVPADFERLKEVAIKHNLFLVEDAAESFGAVFKNQMSGTMGDVSTFSFFGNKTITTGEGGMVLTPHKKIAARIRKLKNQGNSESVRYYHDILGYNYRMTNIQAAIGVGQLNKIDEILRLKSQLQKRYENGLGALLKFQEVPEGATASHWMSAMVFDSVSNKERIVKLLEEHNIETRPFFTPIDELPFYDEVHDCPVSKEISALGLNLPSYPALSENDQERIIALIANNLETP